MKKAQHDTWRKGFPYYKVQYWDYKSLVWREVQKHFPSEADARKHGQKVSNRFRIVNLEREKRSII
jgi:hypothetical protein